MKLKLPDGHSQRNESNSTLCGQKKDVCKKGRVAVFTDDIRIHIFEYLGKFQFHAVRRYMCHSCLLYCIIVCMLYHIVCVIV